MSMRAKLISSVVLAAIALATWRFVAPPTGVPRVEARKPAPDPEAAPAPQVETPEPAAALAPFPPAQEAPAPTQNSFAESQSDRKSTRLNSSHGYISYAVFCLKKKKRKRQQRGAVEECDLAQIST